MRSQYKPFHCITFSLHNMLISTFHEMLFSYAIEVLYPYAIKVLYLHVSAIELRVIFISVYCLTLILCRCQLQPPCCWCLLCVLSSVNQGLLAQRTRSCTVMTDAVSTSGATHVSISLSYSPHSSWSLIDWSIDWAVWLKSYSWS